MDGERFDALTRTLTIRQSRRRVAIGVAGSLASGLLAHLGFKNAAAACGAVGERCNRDNDCCGRCADRRCEQNCAGRRCDRGERCLPRGLPESSNRTCCPPRFVYRDCSEELACETPDGLRCCASEQQAASFCCLESKVCGDFCCPPDHACRIGSDGGQFCECIEICAQPRRFYLR